MSRIIPEAEAAMMRELRARGWTTRRIAEAIGPPATREGVRYWLLRHDGPQPSPHRSYTAAEIALMIALRQQKKTAREIAIALGAPDNVRWDARAVMRVSNWLKRHKSACQNWAGTGRGLGKGPPRPVTPSTRLCRVCGAPVQRLGSSTCGSPSCVTAVLGKSAPPDSPPWPARGGAEPGGFGAHNLSFAPSPNAARIDRPLPDRTLGGIASAWMAR